MILSITQPEFQKLVQIVQDLPDFSSARDRRRLLEVAFGGVKRGSNVLSRVDLEGSPRGVATSLIQRLMTFGQVEPGREALSVLLDEILSNMGSGDDADFLSDLIVHYQMNTDKSSMQMVF